MFDKILYWKAVVFSGLALLLFICNVAMIWGNQDLQEKVNERQQAINVASNVIPLNQQLSQALYEASEKGNDNAIRNLLTTQGFVLPEKAAMKAPPAPPAPKKVMKEEE